MKVDTPRTQFDHPESTAAPATPSCCCCCCCLGTIVVTATSAALATDTVAKQRNGPSGWPTFLAVLPQAVGLAIGLLVYSFDTSPGVALAFGLASAFGTLVAALMLAGSSSTEAFRRAGLYLLLYCVIFPIELFVGAILVLFYLVPYLVVASVVTFFVIKSQANKRRRELAAVGYIFHSSPGPEQWRAGELEPTDNPPGSMPPPPFGGGDPQSGPFFQPRSDDQPDSPFEPPSF